MECDVSPTLQIAANAQTCSPSNSIHALDEVSGAESSFDDPRLDDPLLEICKRELEAVLASLDA